jgi:putative ABC transport system substrate-binding protein
MIRRRNFITLLSGAAAWPLAARAQQRALPVIGFLSGASAWEYAPQVAAFRQGLSETGYVEGRNVSVEFRWAEGRYERLPIMAADLVRRQVAVIVANLPAALAAKAATTTIPIVFTTGTDPVELGLAANLARPGGNLTGVSSLSAELGPKLVELMHELVPTATIIALLVNPTNPNADTLPKVLEVAARTLGLRLRVLHATSERDFDSVFASLVQPRAGALMIGNDGFFISRVEQLAGLALHYGDAPTGCAGRLDRHGGLRAPARHSITSSARSRIDGGTARPSALAVLRFTTISNLVGKCTKRSGSSVGRRLEPWFACRRCYNAFSRLRNRTSSKMFSASSWIDASAFSSVR